MGICRGVGYEGFILSLLLSNYLVIPEVFYRESSFNGGFLLRACRNDGNGDL